MRIDQGKVQGDNMAIISMTSDEARKLTESIDFGEVHIFIHQQAEAEDTQAGTSLFFTVKIRNR